ncbi:hypothetical protein SY83_13015 [Paenibacillus swuensis]|uniref:Uncharacterized protein n=1 Tax=Paenibacillus swuensis TaxID=1178515 RepID=A0A172TJM3_9BACL|nr:hypothetical protein [Paenibacillus swuensis]ANE47037.1 hypothetical protein SY83_13015 [Paenibacillus swuensis]
MMLITLLPIQATGLADNSAKASKVVLVAIPDLSFDDFASLTQVNELASRGALGALNIRTPLKGESNSYLTIGAGAPAAAPSVEAPGYVITPQKLYEIQVGPIPANSAIVVPEIAHLQAENKKRLHDAEAGLLGETLHKNKIPVYLFGNRDALPSDRPNQLVIKRQAAYMMMDQQGVIPYGNMGGTMLIRDETSSLPNTTNYQAMLQEWSALPAGSAAVMFELGDLDRLYVSQGFYSAQKWTESKKTILGQMDDFIAQLSKQLGEKDRLILFSPSVNTDAVAEKSLLAPVLVWQGGNVKGIVKGPIGFHQQSMLSSGTTKQPGLVANVDIAPTVLQAWDIPIPQQMKGMPMTAEKMTGGAAWLQRELQEMQTVYKLRPSLLYSLVTYEVIVLLLSLMAVLLRWRRGLFWIRMCLLSILAAPILLLAMGWLSHWSIAGLVSIFILGSLATGYFLSYRRHEFSLTVLSLGIVLFVVADAFTGSSAMERSVLGYDPMVGARYYGIGNEFEGVFIGAVVLAASLLLQQLQWRKKKSPQAELGDAGAGRADTGAGHGDAGTEKGNGEAGHGDAGTLHITRSQIHSATVEEEEAEYIVRTVSTTTDALRGKLVPRSAVFGVSRGTIRAYKLGVAAAFLLAVAFLAAPALGADAGGAIAAAIAFGAAALRMLPGNGLRPISVPRLLLVAAASGAAALALLWLLNAVLLPPAATAQQSHIGRALQLLQEGRLDQIGHIILRKLQMNWHLINVSAWSKVLITSLVVMAVIVFRPRGVFREWQARYPYVMHGFSANTVGAIAVLVLNDSGIVAAATLIVYVAVPMLLLRLQDAPQSR